MTLSSRFILNWTGAARVGIVIGTTGMVLHGRARATILYSAGGGLFLLRGEDAFTQLEALEVVRTKRAVVYLWWGAGLAIHPADEGLAAGEGD